MSRTYALSSERRTELWAAGARGEDLIYLGLEVPYNLQAGCFMAPSERSHPSGKYKVHKDLSTS